MVAEIRDEYGPLAHFLTEFTQVYLRPKKILLGNSLAFSLKEDPVTCAKMCEEIWVML